jgi:hypothetical protein
LSQLYGLQPYCRRVAFKPQDCRKLLSNGHLGALLQTAVFEVRGAGTRPSVLGIRIFRHLTPRVESAERPNNENRLMSEFQYVAFRAVDRPLDDRQLAFAEQQSSRADVSRWELSVDYHYGSFRGDVDGLLRRGYDVFLQYTNYGDREIRMRLPQGLPVSREQWSQFIDGERLVWKPDKKGTAGILSLHPFHEPGDLDEVWEFDVYLDAAAGLRDRLIAGDTRPLYVMWLCASSDDYIDPAEMLSADVPAGLAEMSQNGDQFLEFYGLDPFLRIAASEDGESAPSEASRSERLQDWLGAVSESRSKKLLSRFIIEDPAAVKAELVAEMRDCQDSPAWPMSRSRRSLQDLIERAGELLQAANAKAAKKADAAAKREAAKIERERQARMKEMVADPKSWLKKSEKLADARGTVNYKAAAEILADLREAIGGVEGDKITRKHAAHLVKKYPTLNHLKSSLRKRGLLE